MIPMAHWPETMVTWCAENRTLFSDDAFGALDDGIVDSQVETEGFWDEMRRYYACIVGKYGAPVQKVLRKDCSRSEKTVVKMLWIVKKLLYLQSRTGENPDRGRNRGVAQSG